MKIPHQGEEIYKSIVSAISEGIIVQDISGKVLSCNEAATEILCLSRDEILQENYPGQGCSFFWRESSFLSCLEYPAS